MQKSMTNLFDPNDNEFEVTDVYQEGTDVVYYDLEGCQHTDIMQEGYDETIGG